MSDHVLDWLGAYRDGELRGDRLRRVEAHLRDCPACQAELDELQVLALRLQASPPMPARTPPEQFVAQVRLRLPPHPAAASGRQRLRRVTGLWLPLGVAGLWAFCQALLVAGGLVLRALPAARLPLPVTGGVLPAVVAALANLAPPAGWIGGLEWLILNAGVTAVMATLAVGCLAGWWAARDRNEEVTGARAGL